MLSINVSGFWGVDPAIAAPAIAADCEYIMYYAAPSDMAARVLPVFQLRLRLTNTAR